MRIQIAKVRNCGLLTAYQINDDGSIFSRPHSLAVQMPKPTNGIVTVGSVWEIQGDVSRESYKKDGFQITEDFIKVKKAKFIRPSGELLARWIVKNIEGCGDVKARRIVRSVPNINTVVAQRDVEALRKVAGVSETIIERLIEKWPSDGLYGAIEWLQASNLPMGLADRLIRIYGEDAVSRLDADPFLLLAFGISIKKIDQLVKKFGIAVPAKRRIAAIAEHACTTYCSKSKSTAILEKTLLETITEAGAELNLSGDKLIDLCVTEGALLRVNGGLQSLGYAVQENAVASLIAQCASRKPGEGALLSYQEQDLTEQKINAAISAFEETLHFRLTSEQKDAVIKAVINPVAIVCGGAGTGKTTILLAILEVYDQLADQLPQFLVALSGRAARRMSEATGRSAMTIAKLLAMHAVEDKQPLPDALLLIVDEASMVDLLSMYRLAGVLPKATRILLVGDAAQLPPVGVGLVFHAAIASNKLALVELTAVKRQKSTSGIHHLATNIRNRVYDPNSLNSSSGDVIYTHTNSPTLVVKHFQSYPNVEQTIILAPTRKGPLGVDQINKLIQATFDQSSPEIHHPFRSWGMVPWVTPTGAKLRLGDRVIVTQNNYDADIRNGDIGTITAVYSEVQEDQSLGELMIDGRPLPITIDILPTLELGYAITIHKSQGSQWDTCILVLPPYAEHMIDQTLIYTGVTRTVNNLVILGDSALLRKAVERGPSNDERKTDLAAKLAAN